MGTIRRRCVFWILLTVCFAHLSYGQEATGQKPSTVPLSGAAQGSEPEVEETDLEKARRKLAELDAATRSIVQLVDEAKGVIGEDRDLLRIKAVALVEDLNDLSVDLVELIPNLEVDAATIDSLREKVGDLFRYHAKLYLAGNKRIRQELAALRRERESVSLEDLAEFEDRVNATRSLFDTNISGALSVTSRVEAIGLDSQAMWANIEVNLIERADNLVSRLKLSVAERDRIQERIRSARHIGATEKLTREELRAQAVQLRADGILDSLDRTADLLETRKLETATYRQAMIRATGEMTEEILDTKVLLGLIGEVFDGAVQWLQDNGPRLLFQAGVLFLFVLIFRVGAQLAWFLLRMVVRPSRLLGSLISRMLRPVALLVGLLFGFWFLGVNPGTLLAGVGVVSIVLGLALQDSLANIAAGFFILAYQPYDEGDTVQAGGVLGSVTAMGLANTTIVTFDNRRLFVPNRKVWSEIIENHSSESIRRVDTIVRVSYEEDVDSALQVIREIVDGHEMTIEKPEPAVFVAKLADFWVEIAVRPWVAAGNWWPMTMDLPRALRVGLQQHGIEIPLPRQELDLKSDGGGG
jgi:small conductance mechanosensitive channel